MVCCGGLGRGVRGGICRRVMGIGRPSMAGIGAGRPMAPGRASWRNCAAARTLRRRRDGRWRWTPPWCGRISTRPGPVGCRRPTTQGDPSNYKKSAGQAGQPTDDADREALGRSRGGLSTKIHLAADSRCRPISRTTTAGQRHDSVGFETVLAGIRITRPNRRGRPRSRPGTVVADTAYSSAAIRQHLQRRRIRAIVPAKANEHAHPAGFDTQTYKQRNVVERCINKLKLFRAVATRYDKRNDTYLGTVDVASIKIWLRDPVP